MDYQKLLDGMKQFGSTERDVCLHGLSVEPEQIHENVVIAPWWEPQELSTLGKADLLSPSEYDSIKVWNVRTERGELTYVKSGIGAPVLMDALLALGVTPCERAIFIGSVGSLDSSIGIGDIVLPEFSVCGDGASHYIAGDALSKGNVFGEKVYPDTALFSKSRQAADQICRENNVKWHIGGAFSLDTIFAQFAHIDEILAMGCNVIEMETAAAFRAAKLMEIPLTALFVVSDNTVMKKSLVSGRTPDERAYRVKVKNEIIPKLLKYLLW